MQQPTAYPCTYCRATVPATHGRTEGIKTQKRTTTKCEN